MIYTWCIVVFVSNERAKTERPPIELHDYHNQTVAADLLGVTRLTIYNWLKAGIIQAVIVGGVRMIPQSEIERLKNEKDPRSPTPES